MAYLNKNAAPVIEQVEITPANYRFPAPSIALAPSQNISLPPLGRRPPRPASSSTSDGGSVSMQPAKGHIGARWAASDENGDTLVYAVYILGDKETEWKLLKDKLREKTCSWDSTAFPDGEYKLKVTASDAPGNPVEQALAAELVSDPFLIDNSAPEISGLTGSISGGKLNLRWKAVDALSSISKAEFSINGGEWLVAEPTSKLSDSREEDYSVAVEKPAGVEFTVAVRVSDDYENQAVAKVVVR